MTDNGLVSVGTRIMIVVTTNRDEPVQITERGKAVVESGLSVRQAHEIRTGCTADNPCAQCR